MKIDIDQVELTLVEQGISNDVIKSVIASLEQAAQEEKEARAAEKNADDKQKKTLVGLYNKDSQGKDGILVGWVVQVEDNHDISLLKEQIVTEVIEFNGTKKGKKAPIRNLGEAFEALPPKFFKNQKISRKTKEAIYFVPVANNLEF